MKKNRHSKYAIIKKISTAFVLLSLSIGLTTPTYAENHGERDNRHEKHQGRQRVEQGPNFRGDIRHFRDHDLNVWNRGSWRRTRHEGRLGWWWVIGGLWYFYPQPVYPSPDPYAPPIIVTQSINDPQERVAPVVVDPVPTPLSWYYCESAQGYYPYTPSCPEGWKTVPATPPNPSATPTVK